MAQLDAGAKRLQGRRILITGAASGMGKAIAERFAKEGAALVLLDMNGEALGAVAKAIGAHAITTDVSVEAEVQAAVAEAIGKLGGLDGVVNAAGILIYSAIVDTDLATWNKFFAVNTLGPILVCRHATP